MTNRFFLCGALLLAGGCGPNPQRAAFTSEWARTVHNGLTNNQTESSLTVTADGRRFRLTERDEIRELQQAYDGTTIASQYTYLNVSTAPAVGEEPMMATMISESTMPTKSPIDTHPIDAGHLAALRFWIQPAKGRSSEGILVAGHLTRMYEQRFENPQTITTTQRWIDLKTGITLQEIDTLYALPTRVVITKTVTTCRHITYAAVEAQVFHL